MFATGLEGADREKRGLEGISAKVAEKLKSEKEKRRGEVTRPFHFSNSKKIKTG